MQATNPTFGLVLTNAISISSDETRLEIVPVISRRTCPLGKHCALGLAPYFYVSPGLWNRLKTHSFSARVILQYEGRLHLSNKTFESVQIITYNQSWLGLL